jgi:uncharacterized protein YodC (DUF2158 family)
MTVIKSGDLVVLRSGGPVMTVDTVNTSIFDDDEITGVFCAWFDGDKLQRVRFDHHAVEPAPAPSALLQDAPPQATSGEYKAVMDGMVDAMNHPAEAEQPVIAAPPRPKRTRPRKEAEVPVPGVSRTH